MRKHTKVGMSLALIAAIASASGGVTEESASQAAKLQLPKEKETVLGLYVTAKGAYEKWKAEPDKIKIIDVRTPEEYFWVGHPTLAWIIPFAAVVYEWDPVKKQFPPKLLPDFVSRVSEVAKPDDTLILMCRAGDRSAMAVNLLAKAGFTQAYTITDGKAMIKVGRWANEHKHAAAYIQNRQTFSLEAEHTYEGLKDVDMVPSLSAQNMECIKIGKDFMLSHG